MLDIGLMKSYCFNHNSMAVTCYHAGWRKAYVMSSLMFNYLNCQAVFVFVYIYCYQLTTVVIWMLGTCIYSAALETSRSIFPCFLEQLVNFTFLNICITIRYRSRRLFVFYNSLSCPSNISVGGHELSKSSGNAFAAAHLWPCLSCRLVSIIRTFDVELFGPGVDEFLWLDMWTTIWTRDWLWFDDVVFWLVHLNLMNMVYWY